MINTVDYTNPKADELIEQAIAATDRDEVISLWKDVQEETGYDYAYLYIVNIQLSILLRIIWIFPLIRRYRIRMDTELLL